MGYLRKLGDLPRNPPITSIVLVVCIALFAFIHRNPDGDSLQALESAGWRDANAIWEGQWWPLITTAFLHYELWHLAFNMYWLWVLGGRLELEIGSARFLAFVLTAAFFTSAMQLAVSSTTGIGFSGVGYAIFGLMWVARRWRPAFAVVLTPRICQLFIFWMFGCLFMTWASDLDIGNTAHFSGLLFGAIASPLLAQPARKRPALIGLAASLSVAVLSLVWAPWNTHWIGNRAYQAHVDGNYQKAIDLYAKVLERDPQAGWARTCMEYARQALASSPAPSSD
ncbi:Rhomboid protease GlpG [Caulifigura coniformis]|uniref:Rhomboid protease GlpG n=1 Tax=Caulifigura coniformis TaxID=2527983 RepID=A0A517S7D0_9PLAN|nr:rhomboid family intramembrane serine protease [Caulifigura coniformis]QDT52027.1 Rhomboid protease GlpG [Caulifigura coniformis]